MTQLRGAVCLICATFLSTGYPEDCPEGLDPTPWTPFNWRENHILLWGPTWPDHVKASPSMRNPDEIDETVTVHEAHVSGPALATISTGLRVFMQMEYTFEQSPRAYGSRLYLPVHAACYAIAREVMAASGSRITSLGDLWMTLERRCKEAISYGQTPGFYLPAIPNNRPGEPIELGLGRYYIPPQAMCPPTFSLRTCGGEWWIRDPLKIPNLTKSLMSTLERAESPLADEGFSNKFDSLPSEIGNVIIEDLIACILTEGSTSVECTYLIPQYRWKQAFIQIPFLWDLEIEIVEQKDQEGTTGQFEWNWEKLARQMLAEFPIFREDEKRRDQQVTTGLFRQIWKKPKRNILSKLPTSRMDEDFDYKPYNQWNYHTAGRSVPPALANRRRIWQILMDMYPNDVGMVHHKGEEDEDFESESILQD